MSNKRKSMLQIRRLLQMLSNGSSIREINREMGIHRRTIRIYIERFRASGHSNETLLRLTDSALSEVVQIKEKEIRFQGNRELSEVKLKGYIKELQHPHVTRQLLWEEYRNEEPEGYSYSQFCEYLYRYKKQTEVSLQMDHPPGERCEIDFAGDFLYYYDSVNKTKVSCPVLVCTLPSSGFSYVEPLGSSRLVDLIPALNRSLEYLGGVPMFIVTDNMAQIVSRVSRYEPKFTELAEQWSLHYNTSIKAVRVKKPKDKASVEKAVHLSYQRIYAQMRNETYYSLSALKYRVKELLEAFNDRPMKVYRISRRERFLKDEKSYLRPLPESLYVLKYKTQSRVKKNYHVLLGEDWHQYSVPYQYIGQQTSLVYDSEIVEIFLDNYQRIAVHQRDTSRYGTTTLSEHRPESHRRYLQQRELNEDDFLSWASTIGNSTEEAVVKLLSAKSFIEQTYDACLGLMQLARKYGEQRLEAACKRANQCGRITYTMLKNILENNQDKTPEPNRIILQIPEHENLRGPKTYY